MPRTRPAVQALALSLSGIVTLSTVVALNVVAAQQHREALWASAGTQAVQQVVIIGQRAPRS